MFNGKDTAENLRRALWHYRHQVYKLKKLKWMGKCMKVFLFGDYDFQCKVFGLSGAAGTHPCVWCYTTKRQMQKAPETQPAIQERTLRGMRRDYRKFLKGGENKKKGSSMQQCHQLSSLQSAHVPRLSSLPTLGIVKKHYMPEDECHELDNIATCLAQTKQPIDKNTHFGKYVTKLRSK